MNLLITPLMYHTNNVWDWLTGPALSVILQLFSIFEAANARL